MEEMTLTSPTFPMAHTSALKGGASISHHQLVRLTQSYTDSEQACTSPVNSWLQWKCSAQKRSYIPFSYLVALTFFLSIPQWGCLFEGKWSSEAHISLSPWFPVGRIVCHALGSVALFKKLCHWGWALRFLKALLSSKSLTRSALWLWNKMWALSCSFALPS